ncbi:MAG: hypothetical protein JWP04_445 [Belnapia sp.]|nr:hypothetical protein [Belnapia sp.]
MDIHDLPTFVSHKRVQAAPIKRVHDNILTLDMGGGDEIHVEAGIGMFARYMPVPGDYLVVYPPDGYRSISPKAAFDDGYTLAPDKTTEG